MAVFTFIDFESFLSGWFSNNFFFFFSKITANFIFFMLDLGKDSIYIIFPSLP